MKKRTKITLRTKIYLTIVGLLALTGVLYAANPTPFVFTIPFPTGVAAAPDLLLVSEYCSEKIDQVDCSGNATLFATLPGFGSCREKYMAIAPSMSAAAGFTPRDVFVTEGDTVFKIDANTHAVTLFATLTGCTSPDHNGITFDHFGTFGNDMIVTCREGNVFRVHGDGTATLIAGPFGLEIEGPAVVPPGFGPHGGEIWVADEDANAVHAVGPPPTYTVTLNILSHVSAEGVYVIPSPPCAFCDAPPAGPSAFFLAEQQNLQFVWRYPLSDFTGLGGNVIVTSESGVQGADTSLVTVSGGNYVQSSFGPRIGGVNEGASFADCNVPTATPTPTPTATFTPTPTATATFTPTPTATFTPTPTATATATATATFTPTPTPTPTPTGHISQITPTGTTCAQFRDGTAATLDHLNYSVLNGKVKNNVTPGVFFYWVSVTVAGGNNSVTITQTITTGNFTCKFAVANGSNVFDSNCNSVPDTITQNPATGAVTAQFTAPAGTYIIGIKYDSKSIAGCTAPGPATTVHYDFATTGVPGSTQGLDLIKNP
jgi:hypothetical protein